MLTHFTAGKPEGTLEERWVDLGEAAELIAAAPDDEILGEILALQVRYLWLCCCALDFAAGPASIPCTLLHRWRNALLRSSLKPRRQRRGHNLELRMLLVQAELAAVMLANRAAVVPLIPKVLADLPEQQEAAAHRDACAAFVRDFHMVSQLTSRPVPTGAMFATHEFGSRKRCNVHAAAAIAVPCGLGSPADRCIALSLAPSISFAPRMPRASGR